MCKDEFRDGEEEGSRTIYSPWFPRGGGRGRFAAGVIQSDGEEPKMEILDKDGKTGQTDEQA